jgi:DNA-binding CsgD family transcriptional regulator
MQTLSPREMEMVELTAFGLAQKEIADRLRLSAHTVDVTLRKAKEKLHLQKSTELSAWYFISKYNLKIDLPQVKRAMISLSFLSLITFSLFTSFKPERAMRSLRTTRASNTRTLSRTRRGDTGTDYELITT